MLSLKYPGNGVWFQEDFFVKNRRKLSKVFLMTRIILKFDQKSPDVTQKSVRFLPKKVYCPQFRKKKDGHTFSQQGDRVENQQEISFNL